MPFSQEQFDAVCNFFEGILKHSADEWWGTPFLLCPWQDEALQTIFGKVDDAGNRVIEMVYLEVPKKSGKTELIAGILLYVLVTTQTPGCQCHGAAAATRQAMNVYRAACKMVEPSPVLKKALCGSSAERTALLSTSHADAVHAGGTRSQRSSVSAAASDQC